MTPSDLKTALIAIGWRTSKNIAPSNVDWYAWLPRDLRLMLGDEESQPCDAEQAIRAHLDQPQGAPAVALSPMLAAASAIAALGNFCGTNADQTVSVDRGYHWRPIDENTPRGVKLQLIAKPDGVAVYASVVSQPSRWTHWAPLPTFAKGD